jgi:hypothetical protein
VCNTVLGGEMLGDERYVERGRRRLDEWLAFTVACGAPHAYNSPTYLAVDIARMASLAEHAQDASIALRARMAEEALWLHVAAHWHPGLSQLSGPHARSYFDGWTGTGGYLKLMLWRVLGDEAIRRDSAYARRTREEGHVGVALEALHCPDYIAGMLRERAYPFAVREMVDADEGIAITTHMTEGYALGTAAMPYAVGVPREPSLQPNGMLLQFARDEAPGFGTLTSRYIINEKRAGAVVAGETIDDLWDEGQAVCAQEGGRAIVAYGLRPRDVAMHSAKLSLRMLGMSDATDVWAGRERVRAFPIEVEAGDAVIIAEGGVYIALIPLEATDMGSDAPIVLDRSGDRLTLDVYNYRGPAKLFWEYRTLGGAFYKGNVRNAVIVEVAERGEFASIDAFRAHIETARIADSVGGDGEREISYASEGEGVVLRYGLDDMRRIGASDAAGARAGAADGRGAQIAVTAANLVEIGGMRVMAGTAGRWVAADRDAGRYVMLKVADDDAPVLIETPGLIFDCDAMGCARIDIDEREGIVAIDADGEIGSVRLTDGVRLFINGTDVTGGMTAVVEGERELGGVGSS